MGTEYFKHGVYIYIYIYIYMIYSPFFSSSKCSLFHNSNEFGSCIIHILYTGCAKIEKNNSGAKRLNASYNGQTMRGHGQENKLYDNFCAVMNLLVMLVFFKYYYKSLL